jgi:hypothetical protein
MEGKAGGGVGGLEGVAGQEEGRFRIWRAQKIPCRNLNLDLHLTVQICVTRGLYLDIVVRVSLGVEVLEGVDDLYGEGAGQRGGQRMTTILENFIQINSQPEKRTFTLRQGWVKKNFVTLFHSFFIFFFSFLYNIHTSKTDTNYQVPVFCSLATKSLYHYLAMFCVSAEGRWVRKVRLDWKSNCVCVTVELVSSVEIPA